MLYDAGNGRFISEDPLGFGAGDGNLSRYVGNSPTNFNDPSGEIVIIPIVAGVVISYIAGQAFFPQYAQAPTSSCDNHPTPPDQGLKQAGVEIITGAGVSVAPRLLRSGLQGLGKGIAEEAAEETFAPGTIGAAKAWSKRARINAAELPRDGKIRYVPPENWRPSSPLPKGPNKGYIDRFGNEWVKGPSRTPGEPFEWDVQLAKNASQSIKKLSPDTKSNKHLNVSLEGKITH